VPAGRRPRRFAAAAAASLLALGLAACAAPEETGSSGSAGSGSPGGADGPIKIGVNIELSGPAAVQGSAYKNAVELVADQVNAEGILGGRKLELVIRDNKSDPTEALQVAKGLIENDDVVAMVGGGSSPTTLSLVDYVESAGVPTISMGSSGAIVSPPQERTFVFKTPANSGLVADVMLSEFQARGITKVGFISVDNPYGDAGLQAFQEKAPAAGVEIVGAEKFQATDKDYTSVVTKLVSSDPDAIVVWAIPPGAGIVAKNVAASGFDGPVFFDPGAGAELFLRGAGSAADGALLIHPAVLVADQVQDAPNLEVMQKFHSDYTAEYGDFSGFASYAADALGMIVQAIEDAGSTDRAAVRDALEALKYTGVTGVYEFGPQDHAGLGPEALVTVTVENGDWALAPAK
jgi:branched-chain amino acid transport system substrate-binding protein